MFVRIFRTAVFICLLTVSVLATTLTSGAATYQSFGTWSLGVTNTGLSTTAINTSDTSTLNNGWKVTVSVSGDGVGIYNDRSESLRTRGGTTSMFVNGVSIDASAIALMTMCPASCSTGGSGKRVANVGTYTFSFTDSSGNPIQVVNPVLNISGIGGQNGGTPLWSDLTLTNPGMTMTQLASNGNMQVVGGTLLQPVNATSSTNCAAAPIAACGSVMVLGTASSFTFQAGYNSAPGLANFTGDAFDFLMSVGSTFDLTYNANFPAGVASSGTVPGSQLSNAQGSTPSVAANTGTLTATGYTPTGWCTVATTPGQTCASAGGVSYAYSSSLSPMASDVVLYEMWSPNVNTVTFNASGGSGTMSTESFTTGVSKPLTADAFTFDPTYVFGGWCSVAVTAGASCTGTSYPNSASFATNRDLTLYAIWISTSSTLSVTYYANFPASAGTTGGTLPSQVTGVLYGSTTTGVTADTLTSTNYTANGWCTVATTPGQTCASANGTAYTTGPLAAVTTNVSLYAVWVPNTFNVTFNPNGGTESVSTQQFSYQVSANLTANTMSYSGNSFTGWCTVATTVGQTCANAGGTTYAAGASFSASGPVTLYATWTSSTTYTLTYATGYSLTSGSLPAAQTGNAAGSTPLVSGNTGNMSITNYVFAGWCTLNLTIGTSCTGTTYPGDSLLAPMNSNVTIYAIWANLWTVTYRTSYTQTSGTVPSTITSLLTGSTPTVSGNTGSLTLNNYVFGGWCSSTVSLGGTCAAGSTFQAGSTLPAMTQNVTLYAIWNSTYTITYSNTFRGGSTNNSGTVPATVTGIIAGSTPAVAANPGNLTSGGFLFLGWTTSTANQTWTSSPYPVSNPGNLPAVNANVTLYAQWEPLYTLTYSAGYPIVGTTSGTVPAPVANLTPGSTPLVSTNSGSLTLAGYAFMGWTTSQFSTTVMYAADGATPLSAIAGNVTLYGVWVRAYTLTYLANFPAATTDTGTVPAAVTGLLSGATPAVSGNTGTLRATNYQFIGWSTSSSATTATYAVANPGNLPAVNADVTLYGVWSAATTYTLTYNANFPAATTDTGTVPAAVTGLLSTNVVTVSTNSGSLAVTGYTFGGWNTLANGTGTTFAASGAATYTIATANVNLYAIWTINTFPLTVTQVGSGRVTSSPTGISLTAPGTTNATYNYNVLVTLTEVPATGWTFTGWTGVCTGTTTTCAVTMTQAQSVTATFTINTYTVTVTQTANGTIAPGTTVMNYGTSQTFTFTPITGYHVATITVDGTALSGTALSTAIASGYAFTSIAANHTITATYAINTYTIIASVTGGNGTISPTGTTTLNYGASQAYTFTPTTGYQVASITVDGVALSGATLAAAITNGYPFSNVSANHTIAVAYTPLTYDLALTQVGSGGVTSTGATTGSSTISSAAAGTTNATYNYNTSVVLTATASTGWTFTGWTGACVNATGTCTVPMTAAKAVTATFTINTYVLTTTQVGSGGVTSSPTGITLAAPGTTNATYNYNTAVTLTEVPATGWTFTGWTGACTGTATTCAVTMTQAQSVTATFTIKNYTVTYLNGGGSGTLPIQANVNYGATFSVAANTLTNSSSTTVFVGWFDGTTIYSPGSNNYTMPAANVTLTAVWALPNQDTVIFNSNAPAGSSATGSPSIPSFTGSQGTNATIANVNTLAVAGYTFGGWSATPTGTTPVTTPYVLSVPSTTLYAIWTINTYVLTLNQAGSGAITSTGAPTTGSTIATSATSSATATYNYNTVVTLTAAPAIGWTFTGWTGACTGTTNTCAVTMTQAQSVTGTFTINTYTINASVTGANGTISSPGTTTVNYGSSQAYTFTPSAGYQVASVTVDDVALSGEALSAAITNGYTFSTVSGNHTIAVAYSILNYVLTTTQVGSGGITSSPAGITLTAPGSTTATYNYNTVVTLTETPATGWSFTGWTGACTGAAATCDVTMTQAKSVTATFAINTFVLTTTQVGSGSVSSSPSGITLTAPGSTTGSYNYNTVVTLTEVPATGWSFTGWTGACTGTTTTCAVTMIQAQSVTATFTINNYSVTYVNGGGVGAVPTQANVDFAATFSVGANSLTKTGYTFGGWTDGTTVFQPGTNNYTMPAANVTLTAVWTPNGSDVITFATNAPSGASLSGTPSVASVTGLDGVTVLSSSFATVGTMSIPGYTFGGWATTPSGTSPVGSQLLNASAITLYAIWTPNVNTVTFIDTGTVTGTYTQSFTTGVNQPLTANAFTNQNVTFMGWSTSPTSSVVLYTDAQTIGISSSISLYAVWSALLVYHANYPAGVTTGGTVPSTVVGSAANTTRVTVAANSGTLSATGFIFSGWSSDPFAIVPMYPVLSPGTIPAITQNVDLYAVWYFNQPPYTIAYFSNPPSGVSISGTAPAVVTGVTPDATSVPVAANPNSLAAPGYTLLGWDPNPAATTPTYPVTAPGTLPSVTAPIELFAIWARAAEPAPPYGGGGAVVPLTITYSIGNGTGTTPSTQTVNPNDSVTIDSGVTITPPAGLEFTNWACGGGTTSPASKVTVTTSFTCIAQYSPLHYTLSYVANFPAGSVSSGTAPATQTGLLYGATPSVATTAMLSATKYVFAGWATSPSATTATYSATGPATLDPLTGNVTLYAVWKEQAVSPSTPYLLGVVFYALDKWGTTEKGYMATVRAVAQQIVAGSYHTITITGSADIRGSVRWNHILGVNRATTAMNTLKKVLATLHYTQVRFKLVNLNVSTKYSGYNLNRRATFIGIAGQ